MKNPTKTPLPGPPGLQSSNSDSSEAIAACQASLCDSSDVPDRGHSNLFHDINELAETAPMTYAAILVPLDGSRVAAEAVPYGTALSRMFGIPMTLLRVISPMDGTSDGASAPRTRSDRQQESLRSQAQGYLASFKRSLEVLGLEIETRVVEGDPVDAILQAASALEKPLMILGAGGSTASRPSALTEGLGSVAEQLVLHWRGPILLVKKNPPPAGARL